MLYLIKSADRKKGVEKLLSIKKSLLKKKKDAQSFILDADNLSDNVIRELASSVDLFGGKFIVTGKYLLSEKESREIIEPHLKEIAESENIFIFLEGSLTKPLEKKVGKYAEKIEKLGSDKKEKEEFKLFSLTDALGERNKEKAWLKYQEALLRGLGPEEILGMLFWQTKTLLLAKKTKTSSEAAMSNFPYQKAKKYTKNFQEGEIEELNTKIIDIYHQSRRGGLDIPLGLEKFLLEI